MALNLLKRKRLNFTWKIGQVTFLENKIQIRIVRNWKKKASVWYILLLLLMGYVRMFNSRNISPLATNSYYMMTIKNIISFTIRQTNSHFQSQTFYPISTHTDLCTIIDLTIPLNHDNQLTTNTTYFHLLQPQLTSITII